MSNSDLSRQSRHAIRIPTFAILFALVFLSARPVHSQSTSGPDDAFIAGCATGAFDSYPALRSNCPKQQSQATTVVTQPLAYTPQQLEEMNKYAQQGAAALQQYLHTPVTPSNLPSTGDTASFPSNTRTQYDSTEYQPMHFYPANGSSAGGGGVLAGIAKAAQAYQQRSASFASYDSSVKLAQAQRELEKVKAELADVIAWGEFLKERRATREAAAQEVSEARAAGAPVVKSNLSLEEAKRLQSQLGLDPQQKHIFPDMLEIVLDPKGQMHFDRVGLPIEEFRYTVVGDVVTLDEQEQTRARAWQGIENAPNELIGNSPLETGPDLYATMDQLKTSSESTGNEGVEIGAASYFFEVFSPLSATGPSEGRVLVVTLSRFFAGSFDHAEVWFNVLDIDPQTVSLRKSPRGNFYVFAVRTTDGALKMFDRKRDQHLSSIAFEISSEYGPQFAKSFKRAVILAKQENEAEAERRSATKNGPSEGKVVEIEHREDGTFVYIVQTSTAKYTLACSRKMLEKYSVPVRCFKAQAGETVHVSWTSNPSLAFLYGPNQDNPPGVVTALAEVEKTEPR